MADWRGNQDRSRRGQSESAQHAKKDSESRKKAAPVSKSWRRAQSASEGTAHETWSGHANSSAPFLTHHRVKLWSVWGALLVLFGAYIYWLYFLQKPTPFYLVESTSTATFPAILSPLSFAAEDSDRISNLDNNKVSVKKKNLDELLGDAEQMDSWLDEISFSGPDECAVLYFIAMGIVDHEMQPRLLPQNHSAIDQSASVEQLLKKLLEKHPNKNKLIFFDLASCAEPWELGQLYNGFPAAVRRVVKEINDPRLAVIVSQNNGQNAGSLPQIGGNIFSRYLLAGLSGANDIAKGRKISVLSLARYLKDGMPLWGKMHGLPWQQPVIIHGDNFKDFNVVYKLDEPITTKDEVSDALIEDRYQKLDELWKNFSQLPASRCRAQQPLKWAKIEARLIALERLAVAGRRYGDSFFLESGRAEKAIADLRKPADGLALSSKSLANWQTTLSSSQQAELQEKKGDAENLPAYWKSAWAAWDGLQGKASIERADLENAMESLPRLTHNIAFPPVEIKFLSLLKSQCDWDLEQGKKLSQVVAQAIQCRHRSEQLAATACGQASATDVRLSFWIRTILEADKAEQQRRQAEDSLLANDFKNAEKIYNDLLASDGPYETALRIGRQIGEAYHLCDEVLAEAPWLAEWSMRHYQEMPPSLGGSAGEAPAGQTSTEASSFLALANNAIKSIYAARRLQHWLGEERTDGFINSSLFKKKLSDDLKGLSQLYGNARHQGFDRHIRNLLGEKSNDEILIQEILRAVQCPLMTAESRIRLHKKLRAVVSKQGSRAIGSETKGLEDSRQVADQHAARWLAMLASSAKSNLHPVQLLLLDEKSLLQLPDTPSMALSLDVPPGEQLKNIERLSETGGEILARLQELGTRLNKDIEVKSNDKIDDLYGKFAAQQRDLRSSSWLLARSASIEELRPCAENLLRIDQYEASTWLAQRALDDFWGNGEQRASARQSETYYFSQLAAAHLFDARKSLKKLGNRAVSELEKNNTAELAQRFKNRRAAAEQLSIQGELKNGQRLVYRAGIEGDIPVGKAAVSLAKSSKNDAGQRPNVAFQHGNSQQRRVAISMTNSENEPEHAATVENSNSDKPPTYVFQLRYRGHLVESDAIQPEHLSRAAEIVHVYPNYKTPTVKVISDERQMTNVMLILDCSWSMNEPTSEKESNQKLVSAKNAIRKLMRGMIDEGDKYFRVGLMAYGHRITWNKKGDRIGIWLSTKKTSKRNIPNYEWVPVKGVLSELEKKFPALDEDELPEVPGADVQVLVPINDFDYKQLSRIEVYIGGAGQEGLLQPVGFTPLYYAISEAAKELELAHPGQNNHVIALTDGENHPGPVDTRAPYNISSTKIKSFLKERKYRGVQLYLVGFKVPSGSGSTKFMKELTEANSVKPGEFVEAKNEVELDETFSNWLAENVKVPEFAVGRSNQENSSARFVRFGNSWRPAAATDWRQGERHPLVTRGLLQHPDPLPLKLEGWESLELEYPGEDKPLQFMPFQPNHPAGRKNYTLKLFGLSQRQHSHLATALMPKPRNRDEWEFSVAIENKDRDRQSLAPEFFWAEVTPLDKRSKPVGDQVYRFCDVQCEQGQPVPVLRWIASGWPKQGKRARIQLWVIFPGSSTANRRTHDINVRAPKPIAIGDAQWTLQSKKINAKERMLELSGSGGRRLLADTLVQVIWRSEDDKLRVKRRYSAEPSHQFFYGGQELKQAKVFILDAEVMKRQARGPENETDAMEIMMPNRR